MNKKVVILTAITSDIGTALAKRYAKDGWTIIGTYRSTQHLGEISSLSNYLYCCDLTDKKSINKFIRKVEELSLPWDLFISCAGTMKPIGPFFNCDFEQWSNSLHINAIEQLRVLHGLYPCRNVSNVSTAVFFAGSGTNNAVLNYSAYTVSKIMLIKMCELVDFENEDVNMFIVGPGWTKTKIHYETIREKREIVGKNYENTIEFMGHSKGTSMDDIFNCINFFYLQGKKVAGGRNFSIVHDKWKKDENEKLIAELKSDFDMYKLRRHKNEF